MHLLFPEYYIFLEPAVLPKHIGFLKPVHVNTYNIIQNVDMRAKWHEAVTSGASNSSQTPSTICCSHSCLTWPCFGQPVKICQHKYVNNLMHKYSSIICTYNNVISYALNDNLYASNLYMLSITMQ